MFLLVLQAFDIYLIYFDLSSGDSNSHDNTGSLYQPVGDYKRLVLGASS